MVEPCYSRITFMSVVVALTAAIGCNRMDQVTSPHPDAPSAPRAELQPARGSKYRRAGEDYFVALTREEPGLAGYFLDDRGNIVAYVTDSGRFESARMVMEKHRQSEGLFLPVAKRNAGLVLRKADYTFQQLSDWRDAVTDSLLAVVPGVIFDDLDEARNRVTIGIAGDATTQLRIHEVLTRLRIPSEAVVLIETVPITPAVGAPRVLPAEDIARRAIPSTLYATADTMMGGLSILSSAGGTCTLGLVIDRGTGAVPGVLTASHCSSTMLGADTSHIGQPYITGMFNREVAHEAADPSGTRYSDVAFYQLDNSLLPGRRGEIYKPNIADRTSGAAGLRTIDTNDPYFHVKGAATTIVSGTTIDKIGQTTGWTYGNVDMTCSDQLEAIGGTNYTIKCSYRGSVYAQGGDSGSPVFIYDGTPGVTFAGILWGGSPSIGMWFSPYNGIWTDLGIVNVHSTITLSDPSVSGSVSGGTPTLNWSTTLTGTTTATTYKIYRTTWNADAGSYIDNGGLIQTTTSTSFTDSGGYISLSSFNGSTFPGICPNSWVSYRIDAYNSGIASQTYVYFLGDVAPSCH